MKTAVNNNGRFDFMLNMLVAGNQLSDQRQAAFIADLKRNARVEKSACVPAQGQPGFICDYRYGRKLPNGEYTFSAFKGRFYKSGDGWSLDVN